MVELAGLDAVDWGALETPCGPGDVIPEILHDLASPDAEVRADAWLDLLDRLAHQGTLWPAALEVVPFVIQLLAAPEVPDRHRLLLLVRELLSPDGDLGTPARERSPLADAVGEAARAGAPLYVRHALHGDPQLRASAACVLAALPGPTLEHREAVERAVAAAGEGAHGASAVVALGLIGRRLGTTIDAPRFEDLLRSRDPLVRGSAGIALAHVAPQGMPRAAIEAIGDAAALGPLARWDFPWGDGHVGAYAARVLGRLGEARPAEALGVLRAAVERRLAAGQRLSPRVRGEHAEPPAPHRESLAALLTALFDVAFGRYEGRERDEVLPEELSAPQRATLELLVAEGALQALAREASSTLARRGLWLPQEGARFLGLSPPGPLDARLTMKVAGSTRDWPTWKWLRALGRGQVDEAALLEALHGQRSPEQIFRLCLDIVSGAYAPLAFPTLLADRGPGLLLRLVEPARHALMARLSERAEHLLEVGRSSSPNAQECLLVMLPMLRTLRERGEEVDPRYDPLIARSLSPLVLDLGREVLGLLPRDRREPFVLEFSRSYKRSAYVDLCPTQAVARLSAEAIGRGEWASEGPDLQVERLASLGEAAAPEIARVLSEPTLRRRDVLERALARIRGG
ncbi:hypothetical protein [Sorangium sp. So ce861]|uniref:hypothetical protein n=1 Tax=Sorangium sp. So ce861 TaxID=3133323 RepID=UPI003F61C720